MVFGIDEIPRLDLGIKGDQPFVFGNGFIEVALFFISSRQRVPEDATCRALVLNRLSC